MVCSWAILFDTCPDVEERLQQHYQLPVVCSINKLLSLYELSGILCAPVFGTHGGIPLASAAVRTCLTIPLVGWIQSIKTSPWSLL